MLGHQENESQFSFSTVNAPPQKHVFKIKEVLPSPTVPPRPFSQLETPASAHPVHLCIFFFGRGRGWKGGACSVWDLTSLTRNQTHPLHWKHGILTGSMGPPGKPLIPCIFKDQPVCDGEEHLFRAFLDELSGSNGKKSACNAGDLHSIPWSGRSLEEGMATHFSILAWRIPWTEEPGGL